MFFILSWILREPSTTCYLFPVALLIAAILVKIRKFSIFSNKGHKKIEGPFPLPIIGNWFEVKRLVLQNVPLLQPYAKFHSQCLEYCSGKTSPIYYQLTRILEALDPRPIGVVRNFVHLLNEWSLYNDGGIVRMWLLNMQYLLIFKVEYYEKILANVKHVQKSRDYDILKGSPIEGGLIAQTDDAIWRRHRKIVTPAFHFHNLRKYIPVFHEESTILLAKMERKFKTPDKNVVVDNMLPLLQLSSFEMIVRNVFGVSLHAQEQERHPFLEAIHDSLKVVQHRLSNPLVFGPVLYKLSGFQSRMEKSTKYCREFTDSVIRQKRLELKKKAQNRDNKTMEIPEGNIGDQQNDRKRFTESFKGEDYKQENSNAQAKNENVHGENHFERPKKHKTDDNTNSTSVTSSTMTSETTSETEPENSPRDIKPDDRGLIVYKESKSFLELIIEDEVNQTQKMTDEEIRNHMNTLMFAGYDTTANTVSLALLMLATHPDVQEKVAKEISSVFAEPEEDDGHTPTYSELMELSLLDLVIKETTRLYPAAPIIGREVIEDTPMGEYILPKGTSLLFPIFLLQRDPRYHPRPNDFWPDRFLPSNPMIKFSCVPFSAGSRNCVGQKYAILQMKIVLSTILRKYNVSTESSIRSVFDVDELVNMSMILSVQRVPLTFTPRTKVY